jgi:DNA (cytosine-5)-methyltransferase 1
LRPKSGLPKRKALKNMPRFEHGLRTNPATRELLNPQLRGIPSPASAITAVSMFAGCGGLDLGMLGGFSYLGEFFPPLPFRILRAYDNDAKAVETYRLNLSDDIELRDLTTMSVAEMPRADVLLGGFPCQDFSSCGHKRGLDGHRGQLYQVMVDYMREHQPLVVMGENVPLFAGMKNGSVIARVVEDLESAGYRVNVWKINCPDYGLPQSRHRVIISCVRSDIEHVLQPPTMTHFMRHRSIDEAIDDLMEVTDESVPNQSQYFVATKATAGAGQGDHTSERGRLGYAVRANAKARVHFHYELERRLTIRECARLQSFPDEFVFPFSASTNLMQIGNAVPPIVGHHLGRSIVDLFYACCIGEEMQTDTVTGEA